MIVIRTDSLGSWNCRKGKTFSTFPLSLFFFMAVGFAIKIIVIGEGISNPRQITQRLLLIGIGSNFSTILPGIRGGIT
jgi:hypothetical protein